jgi:hypothetical protein
VRVFFPGQDVEKMLQPSGEIELNKRVWRSDAPAFRRLSFRVQTCVAATSRGT